MTDKQKITVRFATALDVEVTLQEILQEIANAAVTIAGWRKPVHLSDARRYMIDISNKYTEASQQYNLAMGTGQMVRVGLGSREYRGPMLPSSWYQKIDDFIGQVGKAIVALGQRRDGEADFTAEIKRIAQEFGCAVE